MSYEIDEDEYYDNLAEIIVVQSKIKGIEQEIRNTSNTMRLAELSTKLKIFSDHLQNITEDFDCQVPVQREQAPLMHNWSPVNAYPSFYETVSFIHTYTYTHVHT